MTYTEFLANIGAGISAAVNVRSTIGNVTEFVNADDVRPLLIQSRLLQLHDVVCVVVDMPCSCEYTISAEHMGISHACREHVVRHVTGL